MDIQKLQFPIGHYIPNPNPDKLQLQNWIVDIASFPANLEQITKELTAEQLKWRYRPGGWRIKQVVHHCADSHMNSLIRFKLALTENTPTIRPYYEDKWAELPDSLTDEISESIVLLSGLHKKWTRLLKSLTEDQLKKEFVHPEHGLKFTIVENIGNYAWHCNHHLAHIQNAIKAKGDFSES